MSRHGYVDACCGSEWDTIRYRGAVASAIRGKRGQAFLREMRDALDAMPEKSLISHEIVDECGECCAIGAVALKRRTDVSNLDPEEPEAIAKAFDVSPALVREITYENDEYWCYGGETTPEGRWEYMRKWVEKQIKPESA